MIVIIIIIITEKNTTLNPRIRGEPTNYFIIRRADSRFITFTHYFAMTLGKPSSPYS